MPDQLPRRKRIRHQVFAKLRHTDAGRFQKFLNEQATRLGAARRGIRDLLKVLGTKSAQDIADASTAASLGASRITGNTSLRFADVRRDPPGEVTVGYLISGNALLFSPRSVSGVSLILSGAQVIRATGALDANLFIADNTRVRVVLSGVEHGVYTIASLVGTSGVVLTGAAFGGTHTINAASGYLEVANVVSGASNFAYGDGGTRYRALSGITLNTDSWGVNDFASAKVFHTDTDFDYEVAASGQLFSTNMLTTENEEMADEEIVSGTMGVQAGHKFLKLVLTSGGVNAGLGGWIHLNFANGPSGYYVLSGDCFSGHQVVASGYAEILASCIISGASDWATSGFAVGDAITTSGVSAAIDAGGPYIVRKIAPSGVLLDPGVFALGTNVTDASHLIFETVSGSN